MGCVKVKEGVASSCINSKQKKKQKAENSKYININVNININYNSIEFVLQFVAR